MLLTEIQRILSDVSFSMSFDVFPMGKKIDPLHENWIRIWIKEFTVEIHQEIKYGHFGTVKMGVYFHSNTTP